MKPITTIPFLLTTNYAQEVGIEFGTVQILTIKNIESFFNYKTVKSGETLSLVSTVLSNSDKYMPLLKFSKFIY